MTKNEKPKRTYRGGGRKRTGVLILTRSGYSGKLWTVRDGEKVRITVPLGTDNKTVARRKLARLLESENPTVAEAQRPETFEEAGRRVVTSQGEAGMKTWRDRMHRLRFAFQEFGALPVTGVRAAHIRAALDAAKNGGFARRTLMHLQVDISTVLVDLLRDELILTNPATIVTTPKGAKTDDRERVILTDDEFTAFMACPGISSELHMMALTSRTLGGMRTSDLHALDWAHVDTVTWVSAHVPRPKTKTKDRLALPPVLVPQLQAWWRGQGEPSTGAVFPVRRGERAGQHKKGKISYAKALRDALWIVGIFRPQPGFTEAFLAWKDLVAGEADMAQQDAAELQAKRYCLIQSGSDEYKPLDFHSFRRAYNTALADAGVNVQTAMRLAGHRNASTHMRYVLLAETLETPFAALPVLRESSTRTIATVAALPISTNQHDSWSRFRDLNSRPAVYETAALPLS
jgi:integrase